MNASSGSSSSSSFVSFHHTQAMHVPCVASFFVAGSLAAGSSSSSSFSPGSCSLDAVGIGSSLFYASVLHAVRTVSAAKRDTEDFPSVGATLFNDRDIYALAKRYRTNSRKGSRGRIGSHRGLGGSFRRIDHLTVRRPRGSIASTTASTTVVTSFIMRATMASMPRTLPAW